MFQWGKVDTLLAGLTAKFPHKFVQVTSLKTFFTAQKFPFRREKYTGKFWKIFASDCGVKDYQNGICSKVYDYDAKVVFV